MSTINSDALKEEIANYLMVRLRGLSTKWGANKAHSVNQLVSMIRTLRLSASKQILIEANVALTEHKANKPSAPYWEKFKAFQTPEFLDQLAIQGTALDRAPFKDDVLADGLQLLKDFAVFVGEKASAYFAELTPAIENIETPPVVVTEEPPVTPILSEETKSKHSLDIDLEALHRLSLSQVKSLNQKDIDQIYRTVRELENSLSLEAYCKQSIMPLFMASSWDIRQRKLKGETISERDLKLKQLLENAYGVGIEKANRLKMAPVPFTTAIPFVDTIPKEEKPARFALALIPVPAIPEKKITDLETKRTTRWFSNRVAAFGLAACSAIVTLALSSSSLFGSVAAVKKIPHPVLKSPVQSAHFNNVVKNVPLPEIKIAQVEAIQQVDIPLPIKPIHKIRPSFVKSSNDNHLAKPAMVNGFQLEVTTQDTVTNLCRVYTHPTFLCSNA